MPNDGLLIGLAVRVTLQHAIAALPAGCLKNSGINPALLSALTRWHHNYKTRQCGTGAGPQTVSIPKRTRGQRYLAMTLRTRHATYTARAAADLSRVTDWQTDTANIGNNSQHLMNSMQPKNDHDTASWRPLSVTTEFIPTSKSNVYRSENFTSQRPPHHHHFFKNIVDKTQPLTR